MRPPHVPASASTLHPAIGGEETVSNDLEGSAERRERGGDLRSGVDMSSMKRCKRGPRKPLRGCTMTASSTLLRTSSFLATSARLRGRGCGWRIRSETESGFMIQARTTSLGISVLLSSCAWLRLRRFASRGRLTSTTGVSNSMPSAIDSPSLSGVGGTEPLTASEGRALGGSGSTYWMSSKSGRSGPARSGSISRSMSGWFSALPSLSLRISGSSTSPSSSRASSGSSSSARSSGSGEATS